MECSGFILCVRSVCCKRCECESFGVVPIVQPASVDVVTHAMRANVLFGFKLNFFTIHLFPKRASFFDIISLFSSETMMRLFHFLLLVSAVSAFTTSRFGITKASTTQQLFMFSKDDDNNKPAPLPTIDQPETPKTTNKGSIVKDMNTGEIREVKWQDPAMLANTNLVMDWWAALLIAVPSILILDDFFHFLPKDMPLVH